MSAQGPYRSYSVQRQTIFLVNGEPLGRERVNPTCRYRNTVDFHSQRLPIMKFSRLEPDKPRPGKTLKTMFYNILPPTISVKDLKNKRKHKPVILQSSVFQ